MPPDPARSPEENPLDILRKKFFRWTNTRLAWPLVAALAAAFALWVAWDKAETLPGVAAGLSRLTELRSVPHASGEKFSILIAKLDNDKDGVHRRLIDDALQGRFDKEIEILRLDRSIKIDGTDKPQEAVRAGHERALELLQSPNANMMIWRQVPDAKTDSAMRLQWTVNTDYKPEKTSEKSLQPTDSGLRSEESRLDRLKNDFCDWVIEHFGLATAAVLAAAFFMWVKWDKVKKLPGVAAVLSRLAELRSVPQASGEKFSIAIAKLENDKDGVHRRLIVVALQGRFDKEVEIHLPERSINIGDTGKPQEAVKAGHERALELLKAANANVMIWGQVLDAQTGSPMTLHWTVNNEYQSGKSSEKYTPADKSYDLPEMFWADLGDVLALLTTSQSAAFSDKSGNYIADQLEPFIKRVRLLVASGKLKGEKQAQLQMVLADGLQTYGEQRGDSAALQEAVVAYREALKERIRERVPLDWAATQNNLGTALSTLGERESGTAKLDEAVVAYREALKERTRERVPLDWAATQNNLGTALSTLGERESGTAKLDEAVVAYREALKENTRERVPLDWAGTQGNLGNALSRLGERENGTAKLDEAVVAYREALKENTRERVPLDWAMTQNNLGIALRTLGERENGTAKLDEAVVANREALKERTRERVPLDWAATQNNLGNALWRLGERESGTAKLDEAVVAYREALKERTRERVPLGWAATQSNLGNALRALGERESGTAKLDEAVAAYREALNEFKNGGAQHQEAMVQGNLEEVGKMLVERKAAEAASSASRKE
jgi:tetratricopeptide (TPR) repeat protein